MPMPLYGDYYYFDSCFESNFHPTRINPINTSMNFAEEEK